MTITAKQLQVPDGPTLTYDEAGDPAAPPLVLLHGLSAGRRGWRDVLGTTAALAIDHHVFALDQRGHGDSDRTPGKYLLRHYAADLVAFIDRAVGQPAALAGHSLGGLVSAQVAATRPDLVRALVLVDVIGAHGAPAASGRGVAPFWATLAVWLRSIHDRGGTVDDVVELISPMPSLFGDGRNDEVMGAERLRLNGMLWHQLDPEAVDGLLDKRFFVGHDATQPIPCPVHLLRAELPPCVPPEGEAAFLATHPQATAQVVRGVNHFTLLEWEQLVPSILAFLATTSAAQTAPR